MSEQSIRKVLDALGCDPQRAPSWTVSCPLPTHGCAETETKTSYPQQYLSASEAASAFHVGVPTIRRWVRDGSLLAARPGGGLGHLRIPASELERLAEGPRNG